MMRKRLFKITIISASLLSLSACGNSPVPEDKDTIAAGEYYIAAIDEEGEVHVAYQTDREYYADVKDTSWENVDRLMKNAAFPVGISEGGEFIFPKGQSYEELAAAEQKMQEELPLGAVYGEGHVADLNAAEKMQNWSDLQMVTGAYPGCSLGMLKDGTLCEAGITEISGNIDDVLAWSDIRDVAILYGGEKITGLDEDGNVHTKGFEDVSWTNVAELEAGNYMIFGLMQDGSVVHTEYPFDKDYSTEAMKDIVFIAVGYDAEAAIDVVYGIRKDGKVVDRFGEVVPGFEDMVEIDVTLTDGTLFGRDAEGKLVVRPEADENFKKLVEEYNN